MAVYQAPPSPGFSRQEHWSGVPLPSPGLLDIHPLNQSLSVFGRQSWWDLLDSVVPFKLRAIPWRTVVMTNGHPTPTVLGGRVRVNTCLVKGSLSGHQQYPSWLSKLQIEFAGQNQLGAKHFKINSDWRKQSNYRGLSTSSSTDLY